MNEVFKYGNEQTTTYLWKLFSRVFQSEHFPETWSQGLIFPLFKGGPISARTDVGKYRGITLLSIIGKIYTDFLNQRVSLWMEKECILSDEQAGFRRARSTVDQLFILTETIKCNRPQKTYCAFIDIAKAYDRVWRDGLWHKLWEAGVKGKMWRILKNIYKQVKSSVMLGKYRTDFFLIEVGLRQGCLLSPILFDLFIDDLVKEINALGKGVQCGQKKLSILLFADDIVLLANSPEDLQLMLDTIYSFSLRYRFKFN